MAVLSRRSRTKVLAAAFTAPALAQVREPASSTPRSSGETSDEGCSPWWPQALNINQFLTYPVVLNGERATAIIDTGFSRSGITSGVVRQFGLVAGQQSESRGLSGSIIATEYKLPKLQIGSFAFNRLAVLGLERTPIPMPPTASMIIGCDLLRQMVLEVSFPRDVLRLCSPGRRHDTHDLVRIGAALSPGSVVKIALQVEGNAVPAAVLDTGSNAACSISRAYAEHLDLLDGRPQSTVLTVGIEGIKTDGLVTLREVRIGTFGVQRVPATVVDDWVLDTPINIGWPLLRAFDVRLDLASGGLWLRADERVLAEPFPRDRSGLGAVRLADRLLVRHVAVGSPAARAGIGVGDEIVAINDHRINDTFPQPGERQGDKAAGTMLNLDLADGRQVRLVLEDYF